MEQKTETPKPIENTKDSTNQNAKGKSKGLWIVAIVAVLVVAAVVLFFLFGKMGKDEDTVTEPQNAAEALIPGYNEIELTILGFGPEQEKASYSIGGSTYHRVTDKAYQSVEDVRNKLKEVYTDQFIADNFMLEGDDALYYEDEDGLYRLEAFAPSIGLNERCEVLEETEDSMVAAAKRINSDEDAENDVTLYLVKVDGAWKIDDIEY